MGNSINFDGQLRVNRLHSCTLREFASMLITMILGKIWVSPRANPSALTRSKLGTISTVIWGVDPYSPVNATQILDVTFERDPGNNYDPNAIRAMYLGTQLGNLRLELAAILAPYLDSSMLQLTGMIKNCGSPPHLLNLIISGKRSLKAELTKKLKEESFLWDTPEVIQNLKKLQGEMDKVFEKSAKKLYKNFKKVEVIDGISTQLYPHQLQALSWMCGRENNKTLPPFWKKLTQTDYKNIVTGDVQKHKPAAVCGGILADEVGLGKRLEVIALILTNRLHEGQASSRSKLATASNVTKVKISSFEDTANNKFENNQSREKMKQERKSRSFDMFRGFNRYALPSCHKLKIGPPKSTLIVCTFSLLSNWLKQIETHVTSNLGLSVFLYHKKDRFNYAMDYIMSHDIVISTYKVLAVDFKNTKIGEKSDGTGNQVKSNSLLDCKFLRVVLDEGYLIRNSKKATSQALFSIKAEKHWIISNTIIQNSLPDFWAFMRFLRLKPFENPDDGQRLWKKHVEKPLLKDFDKKIAKHFNSLLMTLVLRRTKTTEYLPKKTVKLMKIKLSTEEKNLYRSMESAGRGIFNSLLSLIEKPLHESGFKFTKFDGSLPAKKRNQVLLCFETDPNTTVLLLSLRAGNSELNLTCASNLFLMDPAWNPSFEDQCIDKCHRLGQGKKVTIYKLICAGTIEDKILEIQEKKRSLVQQNSSFTDVANQLLEERVEEIKLLLKITEEII
ncbi:helicase-like transcription factor [Symsagittifera roscoffensis]|uniref:helicase-like transcription factor n=1 Tax=Symsagittifera roscoffensis TaxID=84072 RepID=UPI00307B939A